MLSQLSRAVTRRTFTRRLDHLPSYVRTRSISWSGSRPTNSVATLGVGQRPPWATSSNLILPGPVHSRQCIIRFERRAFSSTAQRNVRYLRFSPDPKHPFDFTKWDIGTKVVAGLVVLSLAYYIVHLERVPETGRLRFMDITSKFEAKLAESARNELLQQYSDHLLPPNHPLTIQVSKIVAQLLESSNLGTVSTDYFSSPRADDGNWQPDDEFRGDAVPGSGTKEWTVMVVNDPRVVNAVAVFGNVVLFTGILPVCQDEDGVAVVLGHEIGHVVARHSSERYSSVKVLLALGFLLDSLGLQFDIARVLTKFLIELPNSRNQELEADEIGLRLMSKACYDPRAAPAFMARLGQVTGSNKHDFFHTHPASRRRVERLEEKLPDAFALLAASPTCAGMQERLQAFGEAVVRTGGLFPGSQHRFT